MPLQLQSTGRPNTGIFPGGWQARGAAALGSIFTADVVVLRAGDTVIGAGMDVSPDTLTVWTGRARVQSRDLQGTNAAGPAGQDVNARRYIVQLPYSVGLVEVGDEVLVIGTSDPALDRRSLRVVTVLTGTLRFTRDLECVLDSMDVV